MNPSSAIMFCPSSLIMKSTNAFALSVIASFLFTTKKGLDIGYFPATTLSSLASTPSIFKSFKVSSKYPKICML